MTKEQMIVSSLIKGSEDGKVIRSNLAYALDRLGDRALEGGEAVVYRAAIFYYKQTSGLISRDIFEDMLKQKVKKEDVYSRLIVLFDEAEHAKVSDSKFHYAVERVRAEREELAYMEALVTASRCLRSKVFVGKKEYKGYRGSREYLDMALGQLDQSTQSVSSEEDIRAKGYSLWKSYQKIKSGEISSIGALTGFTFLDNVTNGGHSGEFWLGAAYAGQGKSFSLINSSWNAAVMQHKDVLFLTAEMPIFQIKRRIIARHSHLDKFELEGGLVIDDIKFGRLSEKQEKIYKAVIDDFSSNKNYGRFFIVQIPAGGTIDFIKSKAQQYGVRADIEAIYIDYLSLLAPRRRRSAGWEELGETIKGCKQLSMDFRRGKGVFVFSAFQTKRKGWEAARDKGRYDLSDLAESAEAERSTDFVYWLLRTEELEVKNEVKIGIAKHRDGSKGEGEGFLYENFASGYLGDIQEDLIE